MSKENSSAGSSGAEAQARGRRENAVRFSPEEVAVIIAEKLGVDDLSYFWCDTGITVFGEGIEKEHRGKHGKS